MILGGVFAAVLIGLASTASAWEFQAPSGHPVDRATSPDGTFILDYQGITAASGNQPWHFEDGDTVILYLTVHAEPGRVVDVRNVRLESPYFRFVPLDEGPWQVTAKPDSRNISYAQMELPLRLEILYMTTRSLLTVSAEIEGYPMSVEAAGRLGGADVPATGGFLVALGPVALVAYGAASRRRRQSAW